MLPIQKQLELVSLLSSGTSGDRSLRIQGGSTQIATAFARFLGDCIHLNTPVVRIQQQEQTVAVRPKNSSGAG